MRIILISFKVTMSSCIIYSEETSSYELKNDKKNPTINDKTFVRNLLLYIYLSTKLSQKV